MGDAGVGILGAAIGVGGLVGAFVALALGARRGLAPHARDGARALGCPDRGHRPRARSARRPRSRWGSWASATRCSTWPASRCCSAASRTGRGPRCSRSSRSGSASPSAPGGVIGALLLAAPRDRGAPWSATGLVLPLVADRSRGPLAAPGPGGGRPGAPRRAAAGDPAVPPAAAGGARAARVRDAPGDLRRGRAPDDRGRARRHVPRHRARRGRGQRRPAARSAARVRATASARSPCCVPCRGPRP